LPSHQGAGLGTLLLYSLLGEADAARAPIRLRVLRTNPARRLYERLGFAVAGESATHFLMERTPGTREASPR
jgi:ribosomal protein S18 acetylase RimI-like enzyme